MAYITFSNISIAFDKMDVFNDFSFEIEKGEIIQFAAPSGGGKTTLFRMLLGFVQPAEGIVAVDGIKIAGGTIADIRKKIAYLSQDIDFSEGKTGDVIMEILNFHHNKNSGITMEDVKKEAEGLELSDDIWSRFTSRLSGGERQRLGLALALALKREIILLDEPTSALDARMKRKVKGRILNSDKTILIVSHDSIWKHKSIRTVTW